MRAKATAISAKTDMHLKRRMSIREKISYQPIEKNVRPVRTVFGNFGRTPIVIIPKTRVVRSFFCNALWKTSNNLHGLDLLHFSTCLSICMAPLQDNHSEVPLIQAWPKGLVRDIVSWQRRLASPSSFIQRNRTGFRSTSLKSTCASIWASLVKSLYRVTAHQKSRYHIANCKTWQMKSRFWEVYSLRNNAFFLLAYQ